MEEPILPRKPWKDPQALQKRLERAAESMRQEEARLRRVSGWATLGFALALGVISGCTPTAVYGGPPPSLQTATPSASPAPQPLKTPTAQEPPPVPVYGAPSNMPATPIINQQPSAEVYGVPRPPNSPPVVRSRPDR